MNVDRLEATFFPLNYKTKPNIKEVCGYGKRVEVEKMAAVNEEK